MPPYLTYLACINVGRCDYNTWNACIVVPKCGYTTWNTCLNLDYVPRANFAITTDFLCNDDCGCVGDACIDCYGQYKEVINTCTYLNKKITFTTLSPHLPRQTKYSNYLLPNSTLPTETCLVAGIKYIITNVQTSSQETFDFPYNVAGLYNLDWIPVLCGVYKIEQIAYNCCTQCSKFQYIYVKDYIPEIDFTITGLCETECAENNECDDCNCANPESELVITTQINIPAGYQDICPCPEIITENFVPFQNVSQTCGVAVTGFVPLTGQPIYIISNTNEPCSLGLTANFAAPYILTDYIAYDGIIYERDLHDGSPITYYQWTKPLANPDSWTIISSSDYLSGAFVILPGWDSVDKPEPTLTFLCDDNDGRRISYKVYEKYPEKTLLFQSLTTHNLDETFTWKPEDVGVFIIELTYLACCGTKIKVSKEVSVDIKLRPVKKSCNSWTISSCGIPLEYQWDLYAYDKDYAGNWKPLSTNTLASNLNGTNVINVPEDNIYKVTLHNIVIDGIPEEETESFVLYEFCTLFDCVARINRKVICLDKCCDKDCLTEEDRQFRDKLNRFLTMYSTYFMLLFKDDLESKYAVSIDDTRLGNFAKMDDFRKEMLKICKMVDNDCNC
jgi:hypothetical protein